jgi:hypothetical protein
MSFSLPPKNWILVIVGVLLFSIGFVVQDSSAQEDSAQVYLPLISSDNTGQATPVPTSTTEPTTTVQSTPTITTGTPIDILLPGHQFVSTIRYDTDRGQAIFQGDIDLGPVDMLNYVPTNGHIVSTYTQPEDDDGIGVITQPLVVIVGREYRWPGGVVPYTIDANVTTALNSQIQIALNEWNNNTNVSFIARSNEGDYVRFIQDGALPGNQGYSKVGRRGGQQDVNLSAGASSGVVIHEMGHVVGIWHEQSRHDRDSFVEILWDNIEGSKKNNFDKHVEAGIAIGPYDFGSIMHYRSNTFGQIDPLTGNRLETIRSRIPGSTISPGSTLSALDIQGVNQLYPVNNCSRTPLLFEDVNQVGNSVSLEYSKPDLGNFNFNDKASSLCIPVAWAVSLFVDSDYSGRRVDLAGPLVINDLRSVGSDGDNWSDLISSLHVYGVQANPLPAICSSVPVAYEDDHYRGRQIQLTANAADLNLLSFGDTISSICVPNGWILRFREHAGFEGDFLDVFGPLGMGDIKRDSPDQHNWNDQLSSVRVEGPSANQAPPRCSNNPVLFEHDHFRGVQFDLTRDIRDIHQVGFGDIASSLCVPTGWQVIVFQNTDLGGAQLSLTGETAILDLNRDRPGGRDWGDDISSVRVIAPGGTQPVTCTRPVLYEHDSFLGREFEVARTLHTLHPFGAGDVASSACVPQGWTIELFEHTDFGGDLLRLVGPVTESDFKRNAPDGRDWNDKISSAIVIPPPGTPPIVGCTSVSLFHDSYYRGKRIIVSSSISNLHDTGDGDKISSVCVPSGRTLILFEHDSLSGRQLQITGPIEVFDLKDRPLGGGNWNDEASSVQYIP